MTAKTFTCKSKSLHNPKNVTVINDCNLNLKRKYAQMKRIKNTYQLWNSKWSCLLGLLSTPRLLGASEENRYKGKGNGWIQIKDFETSRIQVCKSHFLDSLVSLEPAVCLWSHIGQEGQSYARVH